MSDKRFLALRWRTLVTQQRKPGHPAIEAVTDERGNIVTPAQPEVPETPEITERELHRMYVEDSASNVAMVLASKDADEFDFYEIEVDIEGRTATLHKVALKEQRRAAPAREIAEIEAHGEVVGEAEVDASA